MSNYKILFYSAAVSILLFSSFKVSLAFEPTTTHAGLSEQIVEFYNLNFEKDITDEQKELIVKGSIEEDNPSVRALNHFYDPIRNIGINSGRTAKIWALDSSIEANEYSWLKIIQYYAQGDEQKAFIGLGHIVHLIEDMSVPDHTRNDPHIGVGAAGLYTGESPFEKWTDQNKNRETLRGLAKQFSLSGAKANIFFDIAQYFDFAANYSNRNFFSKDTIDNPIYKYVEPKIIEFDSRYFYGVDKLNNEKFKILGLFEDNEGKKYTAIRSDKDVSILSEYFSRLSKQVVLNGTGVINLFFQEAEKARQEYEFNKKKEQERIVKQAIELDNFISSKNTFGLIAAGFGFLANDYVSTPVKTAAVALRNTTTQAVASVANLGLMTNFSAKIIGRLGLIVAEEKTDQAAENIQQTINDTQTLIQQNPNILATGLIKANLQNAVKSANTPKISDQPKKEQIQTIAESQKIESPQIIQETPKNEIILEQQKMEESVSIPAAQAEVSAKSEPVSSVPIQSENTEVSTGDNSASVNAPAAPAPAPVFVSYSYSSPAPPAPQAPPSAPTVTLNNGADFTTSLPSQVLAGEKSETASVFVNNSSDSVVSLSVTVWSKEVTLNEGLNTFAVKAKNDIGESSETIIKITLDSTPPAVPQIVSHANNQILNTSTILLTGTAEASSIILITQNSTVLEQTNADENGAWQKNIVLASGVNTFQITAKDAVGNESSVLNFTLRFLQTPSAISDLAASSITASSVLLSWTAPSDGDTLNSQLAYDIRYSTQDLSNVSNWETATQISGEPSVSEAGQNQTFTISNLSSNQIYYAAIKTYDPEGNYSAISNIVNFQTQTAVIYAQNFDSLSDGNLSGQDGWGGWGHWQVLEPYSNEAAVAYDGAKAVRTGSVTYVERTITSTSKALISFAVNLHNAAGLSFELQNGETLLGLVRFVEYYQGLFIQNNDSLVLTQNYLDDVWYVAQIETDSLNSRYRVKLGDGSWSEWNLFVGGSTAELNKIKISYGDGNWFDDYAYFDAISISQTR